MISAFRIASLSILLLLGSISQGFLIPPKKKMRGTLHSETGIFDAQKGKTCRLDSAQGTTLEISYVHDNPQFQSKSPNRVNLFLHWKTAPQAGTRYSLPHPEIDVCYWEKGDILMFHTFSAQGWIEFSKLDPESDGQGELELKLIRPHHNFSNSDFHYMGGKLRFSVKQ